MNIHDTLMHIFPSGNIRPNAPDRDGFFEVEGLRRGVAPENCERLASGRSKVRFGQQLRESYLVRTADFLLFFRTCPEHASRVPAEFVVSCGVAALSSARSNDLEAYALKSIASGC
jgi:hypothetical protein